jgi:hypothetical protein
MSGDKYAVDWRRRATQYQGLIEQFERVRADLLKRRSKASRFEQLSIDERLEANDRTLKAVREELSVAQAQIERLLLASGAGLHNSQRSPTSAAKPAPSEPSKPLRNVYTAEQFASEILCGHHTTAWVQRMCRVRRIKTVGTRPWLIPMSEALAHINGK